MVPSNLSSKSPFEVSKRKPGRQSKSRWGSTIEVQPNERKLTAKPIFRPFQIRWAKDNSRLALAVKSTQIGYSTATAAWAVFQRCLERPQHTVIFLSRSERQSLELARKAKGLVDAYEALLPTSPRTGSSNSPRGASTRSASATAPASSSSPPTPTPHAVTLGTCPR